MKRFTGPVGEGTYEVILIDSSIWVEYTDAGHRWQAQKTEFHLSTPDFVSIEQSIFDAGHSDLNKVNEAAASMKCEVMWDEDGDLGVTLTNISTRRSVEWTFADDRVSGPIFVDEWGDFVHTIAEVTA